MMSSASSSCAARKAAMISPGKYDEPTSTHVYLSTCPRKNWLRLVPFSRMISARSSSASSLTSSAPPSPEITFLVSWKLNAPSAPNVPSGLPR